MMVSWIAVVTLKMFRSSDDVQILIPAMAWIIKIQIDVITIRIVATQYTVLEIQDE